MSHNTPAKGSGSGYTDARQSRARSKHCCQGESRPLRDDKGHISQGDGTVPSVPHRVRELPATEQTPLQSCR